MFSGVDHIGIAVDDLDKAVAFYRDSLGLELLEIKDIESRGLTIAFFKLGNTLIELLTPLGDNSQVAKFLEKKGPGIHHIAFATDDITKEMAQLSDKGTKLLSKEPSIGAEGYPIAFVHPKATASGVLLEMIDKTPV